MRAIGQTDRAAGARDLLHGDDVREIAEIAAAPTLRHGHAEQPERAELRPERPRKLVAAVDLVRQRRDLLACEAPHLRAHLDQRIAETEIQLGGVENAHGGLLRNE